MPNILDTIQSSQSTSCAIGFIYKQYCKSIMKFGCELLFLRKSFLIIILSVVTGWFSFFLNILKTFRVKLHYYWAEIRMEKWIRSHGQYCVFTQKIAKYIFRPLFFLVSITVVLSVFVKLELFSPNRTEPNSIELNRSRSYHFHFDIYIHFVILLHHFDSFCSFWWNIFIKMNENEVRMKVFFLLNSFWHLDPLKMIELSFRPIRPIQKINIKYSFSDSRIQY